MARGKGEGGLSRVPKEGPLKYWEASIELPPRDGKRRRKRIRAKDKQKLIKLMRAAQKDLEHAGDLETKVLTVEAWLDTWFRGIAAKKLRPRTARNYRYLIDTKILPVIGARKLDKLTTQDVRDVHDAMLNAGLSSTTALQAHRILAVALKYAVREGRVTRNVATLVDAPQKAAKRLRALTLDEGLKLLDFALRTDDDEQQIEPYASLWAAFILTGAREGELLGLQPDRILELVQGDRRVRALNFSWQLQRFTWEHGCVGSPTVDEEGKTVGACGRKRGTDCPRRHINIPANHEAENLVGGLWLARPKTRSGWRVIPLVEPLQSQILNHIERTRADENPHNLVWHTDKGAPIDPRECNRMWHDLLERAGVPQVRLHDARHTTVDLLLLAGVPVELIKDIVGHSSWLMTEDYKTKAITARHTAAVTSLPEMFAARRIEIQNRDGGIREVS
ncbi:tyrosine-type recombinase/integrase [Leifsonia sp. ZF2019]|uniref:site-specific integrase n=1 Tax=Leifsonia sp. ZF2019 TaxID=2781978 RepID=UPI001CBEA770|nr:tyrosine-type recombinase/integrase [Leifsonia sp. ZF2019]UAJ79996.1 tyrosine-type recombinase/integrase [Leifsonia sp. ZF2019]